MSFCLLVSFLPITIKLYLLLHLATVAQLLLFLRSRSKDVRNPEDDCFPPFTASWYIVVITCSLVSPSYPSAARLYVCLSVFSIQTKSSISSIADCVSMRREVSRAVCFSSFSIPLTMHIPEICYSD